ncbi:MAG: trypsin-like peptidase domain-containing protein [Planctomycetes bacterium]|nr:trypsin-like peptidase domain-containing protein [Planctomycetota bacterium]
MPRQAGWSLAAALCVLVLARPAAAQQDPAVAEELPAAVARYPDFRQIVQSAKSRVFPAVVYIRCLQEYNEEGKKESRQVSGSGVLISPRGDIVTNWHVIEKATSVRCLLSDGRHADAQVLGSDQDTDLAVIRLACSDPETFPCAALGDSGTLKEGDFVMAMGAPWGLNRSVSIGIVSCTRRFLEGVSEYSLWLQTDAAINPGNSGGPLVNTAGEVVGINARGMNAGEGMGFAIPAETVALLLPRLRDEGRMAWSWTGLQLQPLRDFNRDSYFDADAGVIVAETDPDSPASQAGLKARDRIVSINSDPIVALTEEDLPALRRRIRLLPLGEPARLGVIRDGEELVVELTPREKGKVQGEELALERFDFTVKAINQFDNPDLHFHCREGVFVFAVKQPGNAAEAGLRGYDILLEVAGQKVVTLEDARRVHQELLAQVDASHRVLVAVLRNGLLRQLVLDFARDYSKE